MRSPTPRARNKRNGPRVREEALVIARRLLLERGPRAVTLANVGHELGMTHANVIYHFGSAADLQSTLMESMIKDLIAALDKIRADAGAPVIVVDQMFDAFGKGGAGSLAAWIILSGNAARLEPVRNAVKALVAAIVDQTGDVETARGVHEAVLMMTLMAFGDAVIGPYIRDMLEERNDAAVGLAARVLPHLLRPSGSPAS